MFDKVLAFSFALPAVCIAGIIAIGLYARHCAKKYESKQEHNQQVRDRWSEERHESHREQTLKQQERLAKLRKKD